MLTNNCYTSPICKHIAKAPRANAQTKALSKSLQAKKKKKLFKKNLPLKKIKNANTQANIDMKVKQQ